ncbi:MAG: seg [Patescibacteria group bacterium]|nr:seg [Patescibacteria group bacterium]
MKRLAFLALIIALMSPVFLNMAHAQVADGTNVSANATIPSDLSSYDSSTNASDIDASVSPENPGAFTTVTVTLDSNIVDLRRYMITWFVDGKSVGSGIGKYTLISKTKGYGQPTSIRAAIALGTGTITKDVLLAPQDMTMMWEATDSYVPPFYQGKKLPGRESIIKIVAIPNFVSKGSALNPANAVYNWMRNGNVVENASGYGNDYLLIKQNKLNASEQIQATASDQGGDAQSTATITVPLFDPKILFYAIDPTTGIRSALAQTSIYFTTPSATIVAEPYGFSVARNNPNNLSLSWTMNDNPVSISDTRHQTDLNLQNPGTAGESSIGLSITNPNTPFQTANAIISAVFGPNN